MELPTQSGPAERFWSESYHYASLEELVNDRNVITMQANELAIDEYELGQFLVELRNRFNQLSYLLCQNEQV